MGLPFFDRYKLTMHAEDRYRERIDSDVTKMDIMKDIRTMSQKMEFLAKDGPKTEVWIHRPRNIVFVLDCSQYNIVTLYSTLDEYKRHHKEEAPAALKAEAQEIAELAADKAQAKAHYAKQKAPGKISLDIPVMIQNQSVHPKTLSLLQSFAEDEYASRLRYYLGQLGPLYKEYGDRMDKLSRTKNSTLYEQKGKVLEDLKAQIQVLEDERKAVLTDLQALKVQAS